MSSTTMSKLTGVVVGKEERRAWEVVADAVPRNAFTSFDITSSFDLITPRTQHYCVCTPHDISNGAHMPSNVTSDIVLSQASPIYVLACFSESRVLSAEEQDESDCTREAIGATSH